MAEKTVLERDVRLSRSLLWKLQRAFFEREGPGAFRRGTVPHYITSNPFIAGAYARVVLGFLRDVRETLDPDEPVYVVELGAGSGRFGYHFLRRLLDLLDGSVLDDVRLTVVLTDLAEESVAALAAHPKLAPFVASGHLDLARFDAERDGEIALRIAGTVLSRETVKNPLVVVANYFFDSIPEDAFRVEGGGLHESLVTLTSPRKEPDLDDPGLLARVELAFADRPAGAAPYGEPDLDRLLLGYAAGLPDTHVLFPSAGLRCLGALSDLAGGRLLLLSADKGYRGTLGPALGLPGMAVHGSFSMLVDYDALGRFFVERGGLALHTSRRSRLVLAAFLLGGPGGFVETRKAFDEAVERSGPDDFFAMKKATEKHYDAMTLGELLAWVRLSGFDANVLVGALSAIVTSLPSADERLLQDLHRAVTEVWDTYFPIGEDRDVAFHLGGLLHEMGCFADALDFYDRSLSLYGPTARTLHGAGLSYYRLGLRDDALRCFEEALLLDPRHEAAAAARKSLSAELAVTRTGGRPGAAHMA